MALIDLLHVGTDTMLFVSLSNSNALKKDGGSGFQVTDDAFWNWVRPTTAFTTSAMLNAPFGIIHASSVQGPPSHKSAAATTMMSPALNPLQVDFLPYNPAMDEVPKRARRNKWEVEKFPAKRLSAKEKKKLIRFRKSKSIPMNRQQMILDNRVASSSQLATGIYAFKNAK